MGEWKDSSLGLHFTVGLCIVNGSLKHLLHTLETELNKVSVKVIRSSFSSSLFKK